MTCSYFSNRNWVFFLRKKTLPRNEKKWDEKFEIEKKKLNKTEKQKHLLHARSYAKILLR